MRRLILTTLALTVLAKSGTAAPPDPQTKEPYRWQVVLSSGRHPVLTPTFRDQLARELRAVLQGTTGPVAAVEVIDLAAVPPDQWDPLWTQFAERGWSALDPDPRRQLTGVKTHILRIDYRDGLFHLEAKQHDGFTGLPTPVLRRQSVRSADMVSRLAGLMVEPDFCPTGTVIVNPDESDIVKVVLKGSGIGSLDRYVQLGRVFAVAMVREPPRPRSGPGQPSTDPTPAGLVGVSDGYTAYTLLKVVDPVRDGVVKCQVLTRWLYPYAFGRDWRRAAAVRCLLLPTTTAPVQLRLVGRDGTPHPRGSLVQVAATDTDFTAKPGSRDNFEFREGLYRSGRPYSHVACVQIALGAGSPQQFPIPVLGSDPVTIRFEIKPEDEERAMFERVANDLRGRVADLALAQVALFREVSRLIDQRQNREALARAEAGHTATEQTVRALADELKQIQEDPKAQDKVAAEILKQTSERLTAITSAQTTLAKRITDLKVVVEASKDPIKYEKEFRQRELAERIKEYVARGDIDDALRAYDDLITLLPNQQDLKDQREKLQSEWAPKDEEHRKARTAFIAWTKARTAADYKEAVGPLRAATEVFLRKKDRLGLRKLLNLLEPAVASIKTLIEEADANTEDGQQALKDLEAVSAEIRQIEQDAREFLTKLSGK
jgi:hypothetical protein